MLPLFISFLSFFLLLLNPAASKCVPRNLTNTQTPKPPTLRIVVPKHIFAVPKPNVAVPKPNVAVPKPNGVVPVAPKATTAPQNPPAVTPNPKTNPKGLVGPVGGIVKGAASPALKGACDQTDYPDICMTTLTPFSAELQGVAKPDPVALLKISIAASVAETKTVMQTAEKLMAQKAGAVNSLQDCLDNYKDALDNFQSALDAIPEKDLGTINSMLSAAVTDYSTCDDSFEEANPLINQDEKLSNMGSNCLAMASLMEQNA